jgi:hypothetical protein
MGQSLKFDESKQARIEKPRQLFRDVIWLGHDCCIREIGFRDLLGIFVPFISRRESDAPSHIRNVHRKPGGSCGGGGGDLLL